MDKVQAEAYFWISSSRLVVSHYTLFEPQRLANDTVVLRIGKIHNFVPAIELKVSLISEICIYRQRLAVLTPVIWAFEYYLDES